MTSTRSPAATGDPADRASDAGWPQDGMLVVGAGEQAAEIPAGPYPVMVAEVTRA
ncbi:hypothetical protein ACIBBG_11665 [Micromonospora chersina]|uniref:hypothetical protein n=1 Tax=Micromonospora chersina TaxID=47854 RepID=UPI0037A11EEA